MVNTFLAELILTTTALLVLAAAGIATAGKMIYEFATGMIQLPGQLYIIMKHWGEHN